MPYNYSGDPVKLSKYTAISITICIALQPAVAPSSFQPAGHFAWTLSMAVTSGNRGYVAAASKLCYCKVQICSGKRIISKCILCSDNLFLQLPPPQQTKQDNNNTKWVVEGEASFAATKSTLQKQKRSSFSSSFFSSSFSFGICRTGSKLAAARAVCRVSTSCLLSRSNKTKQKRTGVLQFFLQLWRFEEPRCFLHHAEESHMTGFANHNFGRESRAEAGSKQCSSSSSSSSSSSIL